jgi:hypothetical protein
MLQLAIGPDRANDIATAWRGGVYQLWRSGPLPDPQCGSPCRPHDSLVLAWRTNPGRDTTTFASAVGSYVERPLGGKPHGRNVWTLSGGAGSLTTNGSTTVLAFAPNEALAEELSTRSSSVPLGR